MNPLKKLNKLFNRGTTSPVAALLFESIYNQPLLIEPIAANAIIEGYLHGTIQSVVMSGNDDASDNRLCYRLTDSIAVLDIRGVLTARPTGGDLCSATPLSYEEIMLELKKLQADSNITHIIGQFASCGGHASNMADLSDYIYAMRGQGKKLIAMIDMQAASAAYGLASAFEEIWITRTGIAGSIGTYTCIPNVEKKNAMDGFSFTYISSDAHKLDGNPDEPLSDSAKKIFQDDILAIDKVFKETVARNTGLPVQQIYDMQARWYRGEEAVKMGLAHKVGTMDELLHSLFTQQSEVTMTQPTENNEAIASLTNQVAALTGLVKQVLEQPKVQATTNEIKTLCAAANVPPAMAELLVNSGASVDAVRAALQNQQVEQSQTIKIDDVLAMKQGEKTDGLTLKSASDNFEKLEADRLNAIKGE